MVISLGDYHKIDPAQFEKSGALDPILGIDTRLFIDPGLLKHTDVPELKGTHEDLIKYFEQAIKVIASIKTPKDRLWREADKMLQFPEVKGLCIGYSSNGTSGRGMGEKKRSQILESLQEIIQAGSTDPEIFELVGAFEEGIGPDLISDMTAKIIMKSLISFTQRVCSDLGIPLTETHYAKKEPPEDLPINPLNGEPIILIPKQILKDLPVAESFADIYWITSHNEDVRQRINSLITGSLRSLNTTEKKDLLKQSFIENPDVLREVIKAYRAAEPKFYDFDGDPTGEVIWYRVSKQIPSQSELSLSLPQNPTLDDVYQVVEKICQHFKMLLEDNQLCKLLYNQDKSRKHESAAQLLFYGIASAYCQANNLDLSPESDCGRGPVDFKVSSGFNGKVLVEIKLTSNSQLKHGFTKQLPIYQRAEQAAKGIYFVIINDNISTGRLDSFDQLIKAAGDNAPKVIIADGIPRDSASKADE